MARDTFSDLLWIPHSSHRVCQASEEKKEVINVKHYRCMTAYHAAYAPFLIRLGLYQIAVMPHKKIDAALIHGLVERWRPETHTFHLPFGEMTFTLEDVSCLWGLPITGVPVTGTADGRNAKGRLFELLGIKEHEQSDLLKKWGSERNERSMELTFLKSKFRERFEKLPVERDEQTLKWYVRAYILDLMSSSLYPDSGGDGIPLWYLDLIVDLDTPVQYNWGGAVLAYLYRHLCVATEPGRGSMYGPVMLLQHWSWTRFPILRPEPQTKNWEPTWGAPSLDTCASFAYKWCCPHKYVSSSHFKTQGARIPRGQFQSLTEDHVNWEPYGRVYSKLPTVTQ
ncbi:serine/threonine-protein phosphatase 7 long form homolog [Carex rostrata]